MVESSVDSVKARFSQLKESGLADEEAIETIVRETGRAGSNVRLILFNFLEAASQKLDNQRQKSAKSNSHITDADGKNSDLYIKLIGGVIVLVVIYFIFSIVHFTYFKYWPFYLFLGINLYIYF